LPTPAMELLLQTRRLTRCSSNDFLKTIVNVKPIGYSPPPFPSLYWPFPVGGTQTAYLYDAHSMWGFTVYWTLIFVVGVHMAAAGYAVAMQWRNWKLIWIVPLVYLLIGGMEALIAGNVVGGL